MLDQEKKLRQFAVIVLTRCFDSNAQPDLSAAAVITADDAYLAVRHFDNEKEDMLKNFSREGFTDSKLLNDTRVWTWSKLQIAINNKGWRMVNNVVDNPDSINYPPFKSYTGLLSSRLSAALSRVFPHSLSSIYGYRSRLS